MPVVQEEWSRSKRKCPARIHRQEEATTSQVKLTRTWREHRHFGRTSHAEVQFLEAGHFAIKPDGRPHIVGMKEFLGENGIGRGTENAGIRDAPFLTNSTVVMVNGALAGGL